MPPSQSPPANWYPDPQTPGQLRYWDGQRWTQHTHPTAPAQGASTGATPTVQGVAGQGASTQGGGLAAGGPATTGGTPFGGPLRGASAQDTQPAQTQPLQTQPAQAQPAQQSGGGSPFGAGSPFAPGGAAGAGAGAGVGAGAGAAASGGFAPTTGSTPIVTGPGAAAGPVGGTLRPDAARQAFQPSGQPGYDANATNPTPSSTGTLRPQVRPVDPNQGPPSTPTPKVLDEDKIVKDAKGQDPSSPLHWLVPTGRSPEARLAGFTGFLAIMLAGVSIVQIIPPYDAYMAAGLGLLGMAFGLAGRKKASEGFHGGGRSWFGIVGGFLAVAVAAFEYLYPSALFTVINGLF